MYFDYQYKDCKYENITYFKYMYEIGVVIISARNICVEHMYKHDDSCVFPFI